MELAAKGQQYRQPGSNFFATKPRAFGDGPGRDQKRMYFSVVQRGSVRLDCCKRSQMDRRTDHSAGMVRSSLTVLSLKYIESHLQPKICWGQKPSVNVHSSSLYVYMAFLSSVPDHRGSARAKNTYRWYSSVMEPRSPLHYKELLNTTIIAAFVLLPL